MLSDLMSAEISNSFERLQSVSFCYSMIPVLRKLYPDRDAFKESLKRELQFFNTEAIWGTPIHGITIANTAIIHANTRLYPGTLLFFIMLSPLSFLFIYYPCSFSFRFIIPARNPLLQVPRCIFRLSFYKSAFPYRPRNKRRLPTVMSETSHNL